MPQHELNPFARAHVGEPIPGEHALGRDDQILAVRGDHVEKGLRRRLDVPMHEHLARAVEDALIINESITPAVGQITHLTGRVLTASGPVRNAVVEIWQCDAKGSCIHSKGRNDTSVDAHFQGYGRFLTASDGGYSFRTIKPAPYELYGIARAPTSTWS